MAANPFSSLEIEKDTGSSSVANTESVDAIELDGSVRSRTLRSNAGGDAPLRAGSAVLVSMPPACCALSLSSLCVSASLPACRWC